MGGKKKGPTTTDELGNTVSVAELEERKAAEEARAAAKARREAKAAAAAAEKSGDGGAGDDEGDAGDASSAPVFLSLEDQLRALMIKQNDGAKLTGKERKMLAKAEKEGRLPPLEAPDENDAKKRKGPSALSAPESWARALEAVSVHVRGGGDGDDDTNATDAVVDVSGMDVSVEASGSSKMPPSRSREVKKSRCSEPTAAASPRSSSSSPLGASRRASTTWRASRRSSKAAHDPPLTRSSHATT